MPDVFTAYEGSEPFVFVSYAHKDGDIVLPLIAGLQARGVRVWYDGGLELTEDWLECIAEHLEKCNCVITFVSRNFESSANCRQEISFAIEEGKGVAVVYLEPREVLKARMRMQLVSLHALFYEQYQGADEFIEALMKATVLKACMGEPQEEPPVEAIPLSYDTIEFAGEVNKSAVTIESRTVDRMPEENIDPDGFFVQAVRAYAQKDYMVALELFYLAAEQGHVEAQRGIGDCFYFGHGVAKSEQEAVAWYEKAANQGSTEAQCALANCYVFGFGVEKSLKKAVAWYQKAAEQGHKDACWWLAGFYEKGLGVEKDIALALKWFRIAKENGYRCDADIKRCRAALRNQKETPGECFQKAEKLYREKKFEEAIPWYRKAAEAGHAGAQYCLGCCYDCGEGVQQDLSEAAKWYRKAAEQGHVSAQYNLGACYYLGDGVAKAMTEAVFWMRKAAEQGHMEAQRMMGICLLKGEGVAQNYRKALEWLRKAKEKGHPNVEKEIALCEKALMEQGWWTQ